MASPRILSLSRTLFTSTSKQTLTSLLLPRSFTSSSSITAKFASSLCLHRLRPLAGLHLAAGYPAFGNFRTFSTRQAQTSLNDNNPNWSNRPPKETILLDGCDFEHWLVVTEPPPENTTRDEIIDSFVKTLSQVVGSDEEARMKIYSVSTRCYFAFGALVSEELSYKLKELPNVRWVLPDSYLDVRNKDYGGEPFINGQAVPYDPKYHEEWIRNNQKAQERNRRNDRPRNADRSRNFERRQRTPGPGPGFQSSNPGPGFQNTPNTGGPPLPPPNTGGFPNRTGDQPNPGYGQNNPGYGQNMQQNNSGGHGQNIPRDNTGYASNSPGFNQGLPPNRGPPNYPVHGNPGFQGSVSNYQGQAGPGPYPNAQMPPNPQGNFGSQGGPVPYPNAQMPPNPQGNFGPQGNMGGQPDGGAYQGQDVPGRDMPRYQ